MQTISVDLNGAGAPVTRPIRLVSAPAAVSASSSLEPAVLGAAQAAVLTVDLANAGGTRADAVAVVVTVPAGAEPVVDHGDFVCASAAPGVGTTCRASATVLPEGSVQLLLGVRNVTATTVDALVGVTVSHGGADVYAQTHAIRLLAPVPGHAAIDVTVAPETVLMKRVAAQVTFGVENTGYATATGVRASLSIPP